MLYLIGGFAILGGFRLLVYLFVNADPARLARGLKVTGIVIAVLAVATLAISPASGRLSALLIPVAMMMPALVHLRTFLDRYRTPAAGQTSTVATAFLRMTLDHDTGSMTGTILRGRFSGMRVEELGLADLLALLRECRAADERRRERRGGLCHPRPFTRRRPRGDQGGASPADGQIPPRSRRVGLSRDQ